MDVYSSQLCQQLAISNWTGASSFFLGGGISYLLNIFLRSIIYNVVIILFIYLYLK